MLLWVEGLSPEEMATAKGLPSMRFPSATSTAFALLRERGGILKYLTIAAAVTLCLLVLTADVPAERAEREDIRCLLAAAATTGWLLLFTQVFTALPLTLTRTLTLPLALTLTLTLTWTMALTPTLTLTLTRTLPPTPTRTPTPPLTPFPNLTPTPTPGPGCCCSLRSSYFLLVATYCILTAHCSPPVRLAPSDCYYLLLVGVHAGGELWRLQHHHREVLSSV